MNFLELVQPTLAAACQSQLGELGKDHCESAPTLCRAALIGFAGDDVRGSIGVSTNEGGLRRIVDASGAAESSSYCELTGADDALGELANLILGSIKRAWLRRDVEITLATPIVMRGLSIEVSHQEHGQWFTFDSTVGLDRITVWLDIHCDESLEIPSADSSKEQIAEGETLLF
jgi:CheY-specific phosphatase CheX